MKKVNTDLKEKLITYQIFDYGLPGGNIFEELKATKFGQQCNDEDLDMFYRIKETSKEKEIEYFESYVFIDPKTKKLWNTSRML